VDNLASTVLSEVEGDFDGKHREAESSPDGYKINYGGTFVPFDNVEEVTIASPPPAVANSALPPTEAIDSESNPPAASAVVEDPKSSSLASVSHGV